MEEILEEMDYKVITYSKFEFPVIRNIVTFKISGETETFNDFN